jgi:pimeloyl-ACP methyl ester carboxylesterase
MFHSTVAYCLFDIHPFSNCLEILTAECVYTHAQIIRGPADSEGALDAFVSTVTGPPGPSPIALMPRLADVPVLVLWGDRDPFTPIDGPVGKFFSKLPSELPNVMLHMLEGVGHCPHDDRPDLVHDKLLPWLQGLPAAPAAEAASGVV